MTFHEILIPAFSTIIAVTVGLFAGRHLSDRKERRRQEDELKKIHNLISKDFRLLRNMINGNLEEHRNSLKKLLDLDEKWSEKEQSYLNPFAYFPYWPTLVNSGSLIKLEPQEIITVQAVHDQILELRDHAKNSIDRITKEMVSEKDSSKRIDMYMKLHEEAIAFGKTVITMLDMIDIDWIKMDKSRDVTKAEKNETKPIVTKEGITIYPDGRRVDSHGTIL